MLPIALQAYAGHLAGLGTSVLWTFTTLFFTAAGRRLGTTVVNATRICFACVLLAITHRYLQGYWIPRVPWGQAAYLAASGVLGLTIGDQAIIAAYIEIGPRLTLLVATTSPLWAALLGQAFLGEQLPPAAWLGVAMTVGGIAWVIGERRAGSLSAPPPKLSRGLTLAFIAAFCQSGGYLLSKMGMGHGPAGVHVEPQTATLLRMVFAALTILPVLGVTIRRRRRADAPPASVPGANGPGVREGRPTPTPADWRIGILLSLCGAVAGPYMGVWLSLIACDRAPLGVAQTLLTLSPVFILPATAILHHERVTIRAAFGALLAVGGAAVLFGAG